MGYTTEHTKGRPPPVFSTFQRSEYVEVFYASEVEWPLYNKWGYIDDEGKVVIKPRFDKVFDFFDGLALVWAGEEYGYLDKTGSIVRKSSN